MCTVARFNCHGALLYVFGKATEILRVWEGHGNIAKGGEKSNAKIYHRWYGEYTMLSRLSVSAVLLPSRFGTQFLQRPTLDLQVL